MNWNYENEQWQKLPSHLKSLPLFTQHLDFTSWIISALWAIVLKQFLLRFFIFVSVKGSFKEIYKNHKKLLVISNHASHIDTVCIAAALPFRFWINFYICAAKDYWFANPFFSFFSKHCLRAIPIERKENRRESIKLCMTLLRKLDRIWMLIYPEGTRSSDGFIKDFKKGVSLFSQETNTPILFLYIEGAQKIMPKGSFPRPGRITLHIGPIQEPTSLENINENYKNWVLGINPKAYG